MSGRLRIEWALLRDIVFHVSGTKSASRPRLTRGKVALFLVFWAVLGGFFGVILVLVSHDERIDVWVVLLVLAAATLSGVALGRWVEALAARATSTDKPTLTRPNLWSLFAFAALGGSLTLSGEAVVVAMAVGISMCAGMAFLTAREAWTAQTPT